MSQADIKYQLESLRSDVFLEENEDSWEKIAKAISSFSKICDKLSAYEVAPSEVVQALRAYHRPLASAMGSERTRLSGTALDTLASAVAGLGIEFEPLLSLFMPALLSLCGRTNKVVINRARSTIFTIIESTQLVGVLSFFVHNHKDKSTSIRLVVAEGTLACLNSCNPPDLEKEMRAKDVETIIQAFVRDANPEVRKMNRKIFESYKILLPGRVESFTAPMTPTMKKYLDIKTQAVLNHSTSSNSRAKIDLKAAVKPSTSNTASTSTASRASGHARTASSSTLPPAPLPAPMLTRVSRKEREAVPALPGRPQQPQRVVSESHAKSATALQQAPPSQAERMPPPPLRPQKSFVSRTGTVSSTSAAPHRMVIKSDRADPSASNLASSGPRRVPIPTPEPKEEPAKRTYVKADSEEPSKASNEKDLPKRNVRKAESLEVEPSKRVPAPPAATARGPSSAPSHRETVPSSTKHIVPQAPIKAKLTFVKSTSHSTAATGSVAVKGRANLSSQTTAIAGSHAIPRIKPAPSAQASTATSAPKAKAPVPNLTAKPIWGGRAATTSKVPQPQKATSAAPNKAITRKPSTIRRVASTIAKIKKPVTPTMIALPPSPEPSPDDDEIKHERDKSGHKHIHLAPESDQTAIPPAQTVVEGDLGTTPEGNPLEEEATGDGTSSTIETDGESASRAEPLVEIPNPTKPEVVSEPASMPPPINNNPNNFFGFGPAVTNASSLGANAKARPAVFATLGMPRPPITPNPFAHNEFITDPAYIGKTPISALLFSIERGFEYSPNSPLSPPDSYANGNMPVRPARPDGPMLAFNHALHTPSMTFGNHNYNNKKELQCSDVNVVGTDPATLFNMTNLTLEEPLRPTYIDIQRP